MRGIGVWFNKNNLISIVITLFYTIKTKSSLTDTGMQTPVGVNIGTVRHSANHR
jgi:bacitracin transport system permease protein